MQESTNSTRPKYVCANEFVKLYGTTDGYFPDFGHHLEGEMGGLWLYPVKLLDGFWMKFADLSEPAVNAYIHADSFSIEPHEARFVYGNGLGHTTVRICRSQLVPEGIPGLIVTYEFRNFGDQEKALEAEFLFRTDLRPCWLSEQAGIYDGSTDLITYIPEKTVFSAKDKDHEWYVMVGSDQTPDGIESGEIWGPEITRGNGCSGKFRYKFSLKSGESKQITIRVAGSINSEDDCRRQYEKISAKKDFVQEKKEHIRRLCSNSELSSGDRKFDDIFNWIKVHLDWLTIDCPKIGRGVTAGLPEYPWWFGCDSFYTVQGLLALGRFELCRSTLDIILEQSVKLNGNGRIIHEILPNGVSPNLGNTQETAHFIVALWEYYRWTGDLSFVEKAFPYIEKSAKWLKDAAGSDGIFPGGYGIIEIAGLNMPMIDTAVYTCAAWDFFADFCRILNKPGESEWRHNSDNVKKAINNILWDEEQGVYCDCYASYKTIASRKTEILDQADNTRDYEVFRAYLDRLEKKYNQTPDKCAGWVLNRNWVINTPMEMGIADKDKADRALRLMHTNQFIGPYGMYLDALRKSDTMTISTGVMAVAQARYGYSDRALELIEKMFSTFGISSPGMLSEMSPDYGCMVQAWTAYGAVVPVIRYFFGIQPDAENNIINISPCPPAKFSDVSVIKVRVLDGEIDMKLNLDKDGWNGTIVYDGTAELVIDDLWKSRLKITRKNA